MFPPGVLVCPYRLVYVFSDFCLERWINTRVSNWLELCLWSVNSVKVNLTILAHYDCSVNYQCLWFYNRFGKRAKLFSYLKFSSSCSASVEGEGDDQRANRLTFLTVDWTLSGFSIEVEPSNLMTLSLYTSGILSGLMCFKRLESTHYCILFLCGQRERARWWGAFDIEKVVGD